MLAWVSHNIRGGDLRSLVDPAVAKLAPWIGKWECWVLECEWFPAQQNPPPNSHRSGAEWGCL